MSILRAIAGEVLGLFVDDERFALAILLWLTAAWLGQRFLHPPAALGAGALAFGLVLILLESAWRRARR
jgi:hypothetical protein